MISFSHARRINHLDSILQKLLNLLLNGSKITNESTDSVFVEEQTRRKPVYPSAYIRFTVIMHIVSTTWHLLKSHQRRKSHPYKVKSPPQRVKNHLLRKFLNLSSNCFPKKVSFRYFRYFDTCNCAGLYCIPHSYPNI